eukprot:GSChrysophyteH2.ASY1.ANO1.245.1 assembled CDS
MGGCYCPSNCRVVLALSVLVLLLLQSAEASNWAQTSGEISQNIVFPAIPSPVIKHWQARFGHATVVAADVNPNPEVVTLGQVYLMGGDTFSDDKTIRDMTPGSLDTTWEHGYKNDVWSTSGTEWYTGGDPRARNPYHQKIPHTTSKMAYELRSSGRHPPPGMTFEDWIICQPYFSNIKYAAKKAELCETVANAVHWSPRRHHAAVYFNNYIYVMGGRAREFKVMSEERSIGGVIGPRAGEIPFVGENRLQRFTTKREASVYKNDVWKSRDGIAWSLVTPGCRAPQFSLIAQGNVAQGKWGLESMKCDSDADCWGAESCSTARKTCECQMWTPREQHAAVVFSGAMYVSGGYAARLYDRQTACGAYACGDVDSSSYRYYMNDVWTSSDGDSWTLLTEVAWGTSPRGGHQMYYYNDVWSSTDGTAWTRQFGGYAPLGDTEAWWSPRCGHTVSVEPATASNLYVRSIYLFGGQTRTFKDDGFQDDTWVWRPDVEGDAWRKDFSRSAIFATGDGADFHYAEDAPSTNYISPDSPVEFMRKFEIPIRLHKNNARRPEEKDYLAKEDIDAMHSVGIYTIRDLANAGLYDIVKLRGFDYPQVAEEDRLTFYSVCDKRALAIALVSKCSVNIPQMLYDGEPQMPWNIQPDWGKFDYDYLDGEKKSWDYLLEPALDDAELAETLLDSWNGCDYYPEIEGFFGPDVNGIGFVDQVNNTRDPLPELQELKCKWTPGKRAYHSAIVFEERFYIFGGKASEDQFMADSWYRDSQFPSVRMVDKPEDSTDYPWFHFSANEPGVSFEYRVWDPYNYIEMRAWTKCVKKHDVGWLDWRKGGPGNGLYTMYVRSVDPAGNSDERFFNGENAYTWYYVSPTPWDIIAQGVAGFVTLTGLGYLEYRRRVRKAAMERYAMKRMRRKFKAMQRDIDGRAVDWRTLYMENKAQEEANKGKRKAKRAIRDKKKEARAKDKKKRDKEKEKIKKKLQAEAKAKGIEKKPSKEKKAPDEKKEKKMKSKGDGAASTDGKSKVKKLKDYEKGDAGGDDPLEAGVKNRKSNKRYKEYEEADTGEHKKDA